LLAAEGTDDAATTEIWLAPGPYTGMGPKAYESAGDPLGQEAALRLTQHGQVDASNIEITIDNGAVLLEGTVVSEEVKSLAEEAIRSLEGVGDVQNLLEVHT
ncbi:MAG: BON domain-containing protein, partial [Deinococcota bacterium]|nr:BON domain-containing protein [Deinococcota bacterium]